MISVLSRRRQPFSHGCVKETPASPSKQTSRSRSVCVGGSRALSHPPRRVRPFPGQRTGLLECVRQQRNESEAAAERCFIFNLRVVMGTQTSPPRGLYLAPPMTRRAALGTPLTLSPTYRHTRTRARRQKCSVPEGCGQSVRSNKQPSHFNDCIAAFFPSSPLAPPASFASCSFPRGLKSGFSSLASLPE